MSSREHLPSEVRECTLITHHTLHIHSTLITHHTLHIHSRRGEFSLHFSVPILSKNIKIFVAGDPFENIETFQGLFWGCRFVCAGVSLSYHALSGDDAEGHSPAPVLILEG